MDQSTNDDDSGSGSSDGSGKNFFLYLGLGIVVILEKKMRDARWIPGSRVYQCVSFIVAATPKITHIHTQMCGVGFWGKRI